MTLALVLVSAASAVAISAASAAQVRLAPAGAALVRAQSSQAASAKPLSPAQLHAAYALPTRGAAGQTIAVVSSYDDPAIGSDLNAYSRHYGLPACTMATQCLVKLNQAGRSAPLPEADPTGGQYTIESALGVEVAHAICQSCRIILAEASSDFSGAIAATAHAAAEAGATVVVTSVTPGETDQDNVVQGDFNAARTAFVAASGDAEGSPYGFTGAVKFPSSLPNVIAVGGTTLRVRANGSYAGESVWPGTVSGCSSFNPAPAWQTKQALAADCQTRRSVADLAAEANPGVLAHITGAGISGGPWYAVTGTSVSAPIIAGVIGLAGSVGGSEAKMLYGHAVSEPSTLHDITSGATVPGCQVLNCSAKPGYDGPTGLGSPFGLGAFLANGGALSARHPVLSASLLGRPSVNSHWVTHLRLRSADPFAVTGTVALRRTLRLGSRLTVVQFTVPARFRIGPLASVVLRLVIARSHRGQLRSLVRAAVFARGSVRGAAGRATVVATPAGILGLRR
jgi:Subtilase family